MQSKEQTAPAINYNKQQLCEIKDALKGLYKLFSIANTNHQKGEETETFLDFVERISLMKEEEAKTYIEKVWKESEIDLTKQEAQEIFSEIYRKPKNIVMPVTKVTTQIFDKQETALAILVNSKNQNEVIVPYKVFVGVDERQGIKLSQKLTAYDREVYNGVCSLIEAGYTFGTAKQIYEAFAGKPSKSPQAEKRVAGSMRKMMTTLITFDWTEHAKMKGIELKEGEGLHTEENMIYAQAAYATINGQKVRGYKFLKVPALYEYSKKVGQLTSIDRKFLKLKHVSNTENTIVLKNYIIRRIEGMKNRHNQLRNVILFKTMFEDCGITGTKMQMHRHRKTVYTILDELCEMGYINTYKEKRNGQKHLGVEIVL